MKRQQTSALLFIFLAIFIDFMSGSMIIPILPYITQKYRPDALTVGLLEASFFLAVFLASPLLGSLSDRFGRRPVLLWSTLGTAIGCTIFGLANTLTLLFIGRILDGITGGFLSTAQAYIADISKPKDLAKNFGIIGVAFGLGFILGPAIGGFLVQFNLNLPILTAAALSFINTIFGFFALPESLPTEKRQDFRLSDLNPFSQLFQLVTHAHLGYLVIAFFIFNFAFAGFQTNIAVLTRDNFRWTPQDNAILFAYIGLVSSLVQGGLLRILLNRFSEEQLAVSGLAFSSISLGWIAMGVKGVGFYVAVGLFASGVGLCLPTFRSLISSRASAQEQGRIMGSTQALLSISMVLGPLWAGFTFDQFGFATPYWTGAILVFLAWLMMTFAFKRSSRSQAFNRSESVIKNIEK